MMKTTCIELIALILKRGGRWRNRQIELAILEQYGIQFQSNTIAKNLSFLIKSGKALSAPVRTKNGVVCDEYWWVAEEKKKRSGLIPVSAAQLLAECQEIMNTYPDEHPEVGKIVIQCKWLKGK